MSLDGRPQFGTPNRAVPRNSRFFFSAHGWPGLETFQLTAEILSREGALKARCSQPLLGLNQLLLLNWPANLLAERRLVSGQHAHSFHRLYSRNASLSAAPLDQICRGAKDNCREIRKILLSTALAR